MNEVNNQSSSEMNLIERIIQLEKQVVRISRIAWVMGAVLLLVVTLGAVKAQTGTQDSISTKELLIVDETGNMRAKLFIVGGGTKYFNGIMQLVKELGVERSVIFTGWVPHQTVPEYIALADVCAMPLRSTLETNCYLSFKLFEYWAMGKPVVVSRVKAISQIVKDDVNGVLIEPEDVNSLVEALLEVLTDGDKARLMGENGRKMVENLYNWDSLMEQEAKSYENLCSS